MKNTIFLLVTLFSMSSSLFAQANETVYTIASNTYFNDYFETPMAFTNSQNIAINGIIEAETSIRIFPSNNQSILIKPIEENLNGREILSGGTTAVRTSSGAPSRISLFPNPATSQITFIHSNQNVKNYKVFNLFGILLINQNLNMTNTATIDINNLVQGTYILKLTLETEQQVNLFFIKN